MNWQDILNTIQNWAVNTGIKLLISIVIIVIFFIVINKLKKVIENKILKKQLNNGRSRNHTVVRSLCYFCSVLLKVLVVLMIVGYLGIDTSAISALIASLGVGIGLAVNGTVSNLAGGILLLITHPFRDGDYISANGFEGTVEDIFICNTKLRTPDNKVIYLPNGKLSTSEIVNFSEKPMRRVDLSFSISYSDDFEKAEKLILDLISRHPLTLDDPAPRARIKAHGESSIDLTVGAWCKTDDYWSVYFDLNEQVKKAFDENGIEIPFPQVDVHLDK